MVAKSTVVLTVGYIKKLYFEHWIFHPNQNVNFVSLLLLKALDCMEQTEEGENPGPIEPRHIREAVRKLRDAQNMPKRHRRHPYFRR